MQQWQTNWEKFVEAVAKCCSDGMDDDQLTKEFAGNKIIWSGSIRNVELGQETANGIAMDMPNVKIRLLDGKLLVANYIFLLVEPSKQEAWNNFSTGQFVKFKAKLKNQTQFFPRCKYP